MAIYSYSLCVTYLDTLEDIYVAYFLVGHSCKAPLAPMSDVSIVIMSHVTSLCPGPQVSLSLDSAVGSPERDSFTFQS